MTPREPDRFDKQAEDIVRQWDDVGSTGIEDLLTAALRQAEASALERAAQRIAWIQPEYTAHEAQRQIRALIPPAAAHEKQRDIPCGRCGHPLWWHQWSSKEHRFCSKPLNERDFCRCKNYQESAAAPAVEPRLDNLAAESPAPAAETGKAQGAEARQDGCWHGDKGHPCALPRVAELEAALREAQSQLCAEHCEWTGSGDHDDQCVKLSKVLRAAPTEGEGK